MGDTARELDEELGRIYGIETHVTIIWTPIPPEKHTPNSPHYEPRYEILELLANANILPDDNTRIKWTNEEAGLIRCFVSEAESRFWKMSTETC